MMSHRQNKGTPSSPKNQRIRKMNKQLERLQVEVKELKRAGRSQARRLRVENGLRGRRSLGGEWGRGSLPVEKSQW